MLNYLHLILFVFGGLIFLYLYLRFNKLGRSINKLPGPPVLPLLGNLLDVNVPVVRINQILREWGNTYYPIYKAWLGHKPIVMIRHPDDIQAVLTNTRNITKKFAYEHFYSWLKTGITVSNGKKWHQRRKILTPSFHFNMNKKYVDVANGIIYKAMKKARCTENEVTYDLLAYFSKNTLDMICETTMGVSLDEEKDQESVKNYKKAEYKMGNIMIYRSLRPYIADWMLPFFPKLNQETKEALLHLNKFTDKVVKERREYHARTNFSLFEDISEDKSAESDVTDFGDKKNIAMLDHLLKIEKQGLIDDEGIKEEVATFIFGGHDTTAAALTFTVMLFAENKHAQEKARAEAEEIMVPKDGRIDTLDIQNLNYLEMCLKESMRLFPPISVIARHMSEDLQLKHAVAPKGSDVVMHFIDLHRDPEFWPNPDKFDPERFLASAARERHPFSYLPFSAGPRNCIGQKFAMMEIKMFLAYILYNFELEPVDKIDDMELILDIVLRPSKPMHTKFIRIDR